MADGDSAAIDVHFGGIPAQLLVDGTGLGGERLIGLDQVEILGLPARLLQRLAGGGNGTGAHNLGIHAGLGPAGDAGQRRQAARGGILGAHQHQRRGAVIEARGIARRHGAVLCKSRTQSRHRLERGAVADVFVCVHHGFALAVLHRHGRNLVLEAAGFPRRFRLVLGGDGEFVLFFAGDLPLLRDILGGVAHVIAVKGIPQSILDHGVDQIEVAHFLTGAQISGMGGLAHGFLAAGHHDAAVAIPDCLSAQRHGAQAGTAHHVDAPGGCADRQARSDGRLARRILALGRRQHLAQDHFADIAGVHLGPAQRRLDHHLAQLMRRQARKCSIERAHRRARARNDHYFFHLKSSGAVFTYPPAKCRECEAW